MTQTENFCNILRERSSEHASAVQLLFHNHHYGQVIAILRQELDSLVRAVYLLSKDLETRQHFINLTLENLKWTQPGSRTSVTDREMVNLADRLYGWTNSVYKLGCAFIHLSPLADYRNTNPFEQLEPSEVENIKQHLNHYHGFPLSETLTMETIIPYLQKVFQKVNMNLVGYIQNLENSSVGSLRNL